MALKAGRVGVDPSQVDMAGHIIGGGSGSDSYTKAEADAKFATKTETAALATKAQLTANEKEFNFAYNATTQKYGYKAGATGEFHPFEEAGGSPGWNKPADLITTGLTYKNLEYVSGGYCIEDGVCYVDICLKSTSTQSNKYLKGLAALVIAGSSYIQIYDAETVAVADQYIFDATTSKRGIGDTVNLPCNADRFMHIFGMCEAAE